MDAIFSISFKKEGRRYLQNYVLRGGRDSLVDHFFILCSALLPFLPASPAVTSISSTSALEIKQSWKLHLKYRVAGRLFQERERRGSSSIRRKCRLRGLPLRVARCSRPTGSFPLVPNPPPPLLLTEPIPTYCVYRTLPSLNCFARLK